METSPFPHVTLSAPDGARAALYHHGAHVHSWITPDGRERLFMSGRSAPAPGVAVRGGVPIVLSFLLLKTSVAQPSVSFLSKRLDPTPLTLA